MLIPDDALSVREIERRPVVVVERSPDLVGTVEHHGKVEVLGMCGRRNVVDVVLERELRRVHADDDEPVVAVLRRPGAHIGQGAQPVDAGVRPEDVGDDVPPKFRRCERGRVEPSLRADQRRCDAPPRESR
jgi:hypothetical protein